MNIMDLFKRNYEVVTVLNLGRDEERGELYFSTVRILNTFCKKGSVMEIYSAEKYISIKIETNEELEKMVKELNKCLTDIEVRKVGTTLFIDLRK